MHHTFLFPEGKEKALTFSYDDGNEADYRLVELFNQYGLKGTFHLNSGFLKYDGHVDMERLSSIYAGHEIACHGVTHPFLERLAPGEVMREVWEDRATLETKAGYPIVGMSYPFGTYNDQVVATLRAAGILYCRTTQATKRFSLPNDYLEWHPTCHHSEALEIVPRFLRPSMNAYSVFYIWGHSHEFQRLDNWDLMEKLAEELSGKPEIWYATNRDIYYYDQAVKQIVMSTDGRMLYNPTAITVWLKADDQLVSLEPGKYVTL